LLTNLSNLFPIYPVGDDPKATMNWTYVQVADRPNTGIDQYIFLALADGAEKFAVEAVEVLLDLCTHRDTRLVCSPKDFVDFLLIVIRQPHRLLKCVLLGRIPFC
jgi:hypothetical protein